MGNVHTALCVPASEQDANNNISGLLKRTSQRMSLRREKLSNRKRTVLKTMPRCSSFEDLSSPMFSSREINSDPTYLLWKNSFECPRDRPESVKQTQLIRMKRRVHDMTSAISGHITPKGFPSYTILRPVRNENPKQNQYRKKPKQLLLLADSLRADRKIPVIDFNCKNPSTHHQIPSHQLTPVATANNIPIVGLKKSAQPKYIFTPLNLLSKFSKNKQAIIIEKLFRDIKNLESYYDTKIDSFIF